MENFIVFMIVAGSVVYLGYSLVRSFRKGEQKACSKCAVNASRDYANVR